MASKYNWDNLIDHMLYVAMWGLNWLLCFFIYFFLKKKLCYSHGEEGGKHGMGGNIY